MKKILLTMAFVLTALGNAWADDVITAGYSSTPGSITIPQGIFETLSISLSNTSQFKQNIQFDVELPLGVTLDKNTFEFSNRFGSKVQFESSNNLTDASRTKNIYKFVTFAVDATPISGNEGELFSLDLEADESLEIGDTFEGKISSIVSTKTDEANDTHLADATFSITIGNPDDYRIKFDEKSAKLPRYVAGQKGDISMKRTINANEWSTLVLPFNLTRTNANSVFGSDAKYAKFSGFSVEYGPNEEDVTPLSITLTFSTYSIPAKGSLAGGTPVLIKTTKDIDYFELDEVTLVDAVSNLSVFNEDYGLAGKLIGTFVKSTIPEDGIFISENKFWYSEGDVAVKAFRCWFDLDAVLDKETDFGSRIIMSFVDDEKTGIKEHTQYLEDGRVYDLQGRRVSKTAKNGLYIKDGKKILVK